MATTDARPGFKLPWSADRTESDPPDDAPAGSADAPEQELESPRNDGIEPVAEAGTGSTDAPVAADPFSQPALAEAASYDPWRLGSAPVESTAPRRKPNKLMADLTRAMQTAAQAARDETMDRLQTDAKAFVEGIHARSGTEADDLRRAADTDVAGIREWSKAEIARIREETDQRIADRKAALEREIETHAARIEGRIERVQAHVAWFETEMAGFFERLLAEDDPSLLAAMAENLPEPPSFEDDLTDLPEVEAHVASVPAVEAVEPIGESVAGEAEVVAESDAAGETASDPEAAFAAIQAAAEAAETEPADVVDEAITEADMGTEGAGTAELGLSPEAAAEAEAEAEVPSADEADELATFSDDALAARLAGLVPGEDGAPHPDQRSTRVVVTGLVSVASIAGFKRQLGRLEGVSSVGVSSGPDGEFVFAVMHGPELDVRGAIPTLSGFEARVTDATDDTVSVAARDPETES